MRDKKLGIFPVFVLSQILILGCMVGNDVSTADGLTTDLTAQPRQTPPPMHVDPEILKLSTAVLCERIGEIKVINSRRPEESDDLYRALVAKGAEALPCLVDRITDRKLMDDPRMAPVWQHYAIGDTAVFTILHIVSEYDYEVWKELFLGPLPQKYKDEWKTNGVYAYFNYVSEPKNRKELQSWWKKWLAEKKQ